MLYRYTKEIMGQGLAGFAVGVMCYHFSRSIGFLAVHLPAALLLRPMIARIIFEQCAELLCNFPAPLFSPMSHSWLRDLRKACWFRFSSTLALTGDHCLLFYW